MLLRARCLFVSLLALGVFKTGMADATEVRVRIAVGQSDISVSALGLTIRGERDVIQLNRRSLSGISSVFSSVRLIPSWVAGRVLWSVHDKADHRVLHRFEGPTLELLGETVRINLKPSAGRIRLIAARTGGSLKVDVIASMDLETYLSGVLPQEMPSDWPLDALKAQAIASRSFALHRIRMRERVKAPWHLESTVLDQVFAWQDPAELSARKLAAVKQAIKETAGEVLADTRGSVLAAYFHADCGGRTEEASEVWGPRERRLGTAVDGGCPLSPLARWTWSSSGEELAMRLRIPLRLEVGSRITDIRVDELTSSGRAHRVVVMLEDGGVRHLSGHELRSLLGFDRLKSTSFEVRRNAGGGFRFAGRGHGHGVGLCQWGSRWLAKSGTDYRRILKHYYPKAVLAHLESTASPQLEKAGL